MQKRFLYCYVCKWTTLWAEPLSIFLEKLFFPVRSKKRLLAGYKWTCTGANFPTDDVYCSLTWHALLGELWSIIDGDIMKLWMVLPILIWNRTFLNIRSELHSTNLLNKCCVHLKRSATFSRALKTACRVEVESNLNWFKILPNFHMTLISFALKKVGTSKLFEHVVLHCTFDWLLSGIHCKNKHWAKVKTG